jgi:hypothetical protein
MEARPAPPADRRAAALDAVRAARAAADVTALVSAVLNLPTGQQFGAHPGQIPALVHEAYLAAAEPLARCRLAAALVRAWVYGGDAGRAAGFAAEALELAEQLGDPEALVDALDAALLCRWGPDDFVARLGLAARLADAAAHLAAPEPRLSAHLWRLTTAWECLDLLAVQRQLRALELLAEESGSARAAFFAVSRRAMYSLAVGELAEADVLIQQAETAGRQAAEPDLVAVLHSLAASRAVRVGDRAALAQEAAAYQAYGTEQGIGSVVAEAAVLWLHAGEQERAATLARQLGGSGPDGLAGIDRDVDFLLTVCSLVAVGSAVGLLDIARCGAALLEPYAGRAVLNAGAVTFHGVVDDYLYRAHRALGNASAAGWRRSAASSYDRIGARRWHDQLPATAPVPAPALVVNLHPVAARLQPHAVGPDPGAETGWMVGRPGVAQLLPDLRGLHYLRILLQRPGEDVDALELTAVAGGHPGVTVVDVGEEVLDARALADYRRRLTKLADELAEAESWADPARAARLELERSALLAELAAATGFGGRTRRFPASRERARTAVRKAIAGALSRIEQRDAALARLLRDTVRTGANCRYDPDPARPVRWLLDSSD